MSTLKWGTPEALQSYLTTALDTLANSTTDTTGFSALGAEIDNEQDRYQYISFELNLAAQGVARSAGAVVEIWKAEAVDSTPNYPADTNAAFASNSVRSFQLDAATTARRLTLTNIPLAPYKTKFQLRNVTGQAFAVSGSTLKYRRHNEEIA
jgi:hypothetical protein